MVKYRGLLNDIVNKIVTSFVISDRLNSGNVISLAATREI